MPNRPDGGRPRGGSGPSEGSPEYDWLYGTGANQAPSADDATQMIRRRRPAPTSGPAETAGDHTRVLPAQPAAAPQTVQAGSSGRTVASGSPPRPPGRGGAGSAAQPPPEPASPRVRGRRRFRFGPIKLLLVAWLAFMIGVPLWSWGRVDKVDAWPASERPAEQPGTTFLILGSDSRADLTAEERQALGTGGDVGQRTDTIMLLHTGSGPNVLVSIPRDSLIEIPGHGVTKINAAYAFGGQKLLVRTLENATGIRIDHTVEIGLGGFVDVVDAVGGIQICPTEAMKDPLAKLDIKKGCQQADGKTALGYARSRHTSGLGDIDRARRQREVVSAVGDKAVSPWSVLNPLRYYQLNAAMPGFITVSEGTNPTHLARFAFAMTRVDGEDGLTCGVPIRDLAVNWDQARSSALFERIIEDDSAGIERSLCTPSGLPN